MKTYIALLRGINVSGQKKIKKADLRGVFEKEGFKDVQTYIQSGNIIFRDNEREIEELQDKIKKVIAEAFTFNVPVQVFTLEEFQHNYNSNPFLKRENIDIKTLNVTLLEKTPDLEQTESLISFESSPDEYRIVSNTIYLYCPDGYGRTKLTNTLFEKKLKTGAATRNWKTLHNLIDIWNNL